jgi:hypothetical protein
MEILHVNMLALHMDNKTIPKEGEIFGEKESIEDLVVPRSQIGPRGTLKKLRRLGNKWCPGKMP